MTSDVFGSPLQRDPAIAMPAISLPALPPAGPVRRLQFVVELVGPRTVPSQSVKTLLENQWTATLGNPEIWVMAGSDRNWRSLDASDPSGAYDSVALAWDMLGPSGSSLSGQTAQHLWDVTENLAGQLQRRALAMPVPADIDASVKTLQEMQDSLNVGVNLSVIGSYGPMMEKEIWRVCAALGLEFGPAGTFLWRAANTPTPMLEVAPAGDVTTFSLGQVHLNASHPAVSIGFTIPCSADPKASLEGCFHVGDTIAQRLHGVLLDEDDNKLTDQGKEQMRLQLGQAVIALNGNGLTAGSPEALKLFGCQ